MAKLIDLNQIHDKLNKNESVDPNEVLELLQELRHFRGIAAYLASCHAATAEYEGMMEKTSKSSRKRFAAICRSAVLMLQQDSFANSQNETLEAAIDRCEKAAKMLAEKE